MRSAREKHAGETAKETWHRPDRARPRPVAVSSAGFTLLEILIAMVMLSFVFTTLFVSYRQLIGSAHTVARKNALSEMASAALHHMVADLNAAFVLEPPFFRPAGLADTEPAPYRFTGAAIPMAGSTFADIRFVSGRHIDVQGAGAEGFAAIRYYVAEDDNRTLTLKRRDRTIAFDAIDTGPDPIVCEHVNRFDVTFFDGDGNARDEWDSESESVEYTTPTAVRIALGVDGPDGETMTLTTTVFMTAIRRAPGADVQ